MTLAMPDSIRTLDLPAGYPAYLGYVDGHWPTAHGYTDQNGTYQPPLRILFPGAYLVDLTVTGTTLEADGIDCEPGNPSAASAASWASRKLAAAPKFRPVIYASVIGTPGYGMHDVLAHLGTLGIPRASVRLLTAHYEWKTGTGADTANRHICGPSTCGLLPVAADGTQWTDVWPGAAQVVDLSTLRDDFFGTPPPPTWTEKIVQQLPTVKQGSTGAGVSTAQGALIARGYYLGTTGKYHDGVDGVFGAYTDTAVRSVQSAHHLTVDGIVGQQTWPVLLGVA